jgi:endonuclease YncB( thermonuclease family)
MGLLRVTGTIDLAQFWPTGDSDADTTKILVGVSNTAFKFRKTDAGAFKTTKIFANAIVRGRVRKAPIDSKGRVTIRLQGIDAPELHYRPTLSKKPKPTDEQRGAFNAANKDFRQPYGETATLALGAFLKQGNAATINCSVETYVDHPNDVFDTYGRLVGDIFITKGSKKLNINQWLVEQGYAYPTFYSSMSSAEIDVFLRATKTGRKKTGRLWPRYDANTSHFDPTLVYRKKNATPAPDPGKALMPKLFRRRSAYYSQHAAGYTTGSFLDYIKAEDKANTFFLTVDFLQNGVSSATVQFLSEHLATSGHFDLKPDQLVFQEAKSKLVDADGKEITKW